MIKHLRINYLIIAFIFIAFSALGIFGAFKISNAISMAAFMYGTGSESDPYRLYDVNQLYNLCEVSQSLNAKEWTKGKHFVLCNDIMLTNRGAIGGATDGFYGILDGAGHTVTIVQGALFYTLGQNATIRNTNFKVNVKCKEKYNYGICKTISKGATIENCNVSGTIDMDLSLVPSGPTSSCYIGGFCVFNGGKIINCSFNGQVVDAVDRFYQGATYFGIIAVNSGEIESCTVNADVRIYADAMSCKLGGIAYKSKLIDCTFNGTYNLICSTASWLGGKSITLYALAEECIDCSFNGDVIVDYQNRNLTHSIKISADESNFTHNGEIRLINQKVDHE